MVSLERLRAFTSLTWRRWCHGAEDKPCQPGRVHLDVRERPGFSLYRAIRIQNIAHGPAPDNPEGFNRPSSAPLQLQYTRISAHS